MRKPRRAYEGKFVVDGGPAPLRVAKTRDQYPKGPPRPEDEQVNARRASVARKGKAKGGPST